MPSVEMSEIDVCVFCVPRSNYIPKHDIKKKAFHLKDALTESNSRGPPAVMPFM